MVYELPSLWDCDKDEDLVSLHPYSYSSVMAIIYVNGDAQEVNLPLNVSELIKLNDVQQPEMVSVQVNEEFAEREDWECIQLKENDKVDFLYFMGGGKLIED